MTDVSDKKENVEIKVPGENPMEIEGRRVKKEKEARKEIVHQLRLLLQFLTSNPLKKAI